MRALFLSKEYHVARLCAILAMEVSTEEEGRVRRELPLHVETHLARSSGSVGEDNLEGCTGVRDCSRTMCVEVDADAVWRALNAKAPLASDGGDGGDGGVVDPFLPSRFERALCAAEAAACSSAC